ncbi:MAG TPA: LPS export ABC transporter periplasmic protein LptC [Bacteroidia bacterium]|nr:LPS export ABC transporter periplasmic protein LptC [Bacteroidia bacterium]
MIVGSRITSTTKRTSAMLNIKQFFLFVAVLFAITPACVNDPAKVNSITRKNKLPLLTEHGVDAIYTDSAQLKFHITAPQVDEYEGVDDYEEMPKGVKVEIYNDSGAVDSYLTANYAIRKTKENKMEAKNNVVVVNTKGERLNTEDLIWDGTKRRIHTDAHVTITTKDQIIYGTGLDSDERFEEYEIKNISGQINLNDKDSPK